MVRDWPKPKKVDILCTSYCGCGHCCGWEWGLKLPGDKYLALGDFGSPQGTSHPFDLNKPLPVTWEGLKSKDFAVLGLKNLRVKSRKERDDLKPGLLCRYWTTTTLVGQPYTGVTSTGVLPRQARPAVLSSSQVLLRPHLIPLRVLPWKMLPVTGTVAADTKFFPFGTKMLIPGYGWGQVEDHGSAIQGRWHIDLFHHSHHRALEWGKKELKVFVVPPGKHPVDAHPVPEKAKPVAKFLHDVWSVFFGVHH